MMTSLDLLMAAPSKDFVNQLFQTSYSCISGTIPEAIISKAAEALSTDVEKARSLFVELVALIHQVLFESVSSKEKLLRLLPSGLNDKLKALIVGVIASNLAKWRKQTSNSQLSLPKLKEFDWRIDIKSASDTAARLSMPTAIVQMKVEDFPTSTTEVATTDEISFEVNRDTLDTVLDGLRKIRDQLASVAG